MTILFSGLFQHRAYAKVYWGKRKWYFLSLAHYVLRGEQKGYIPCPFFDPDYNDNDNIKSAYSNSFAEFIRSGCKGKGTDLFDPTLISQSSAYVSITKDRCNKITSPWLFYANWNVRDRIDPSNSLSLGFITGTEFGWPMTPSPEVFACRIMEYMQHKKQSKCDFFARNSTEFYRNINKFHSSRVTEYIKVADVYKKDYLLYVQTDGKHNLDLHNVGREYDILLCYYSGSPGDKDAEYYVTHKGTKVSAISSIIHDRPDIFYRYKYILFLDDDVLISARDINKLFETATKNEFKLCQASLSEDSHTGLNVLYNKNNHPGDYRLVSGVEIMMPLISTDALKFVASIFTMNISGWGLDIKIGLMIRGKYGEKVAVIDSVTAVHRGVPNQYHGAYYKLIYDAGVTPKMELMYHVGPNRPNIYEIN